MYALKDPVGNTRSLKCKDQYLASDCLQFTESACARSCFNCFSPHTEVYANQRIPNKLSWGAHNFLELVDLKGTHWETILEFQESRELDGFVRVRQAGRVQSEAFFCSSELAGMLQLRSRALVPRLFARRAFAVDMGKCSVLGYVVVYASFLKWNNSNKKIKIVK